MKRRSIQALSLVLLLAMTGPAALAEGTYTWDISPDDTVSYLPDTYEEVPDFASQIPWEHEPPGQTGTGSSQAQGTNKPSDTAGDTLSDEGVENEDDLEEVPETTTEPASGKAQSLEWFSNGQSLLTKYPNIKVYDIKSGTTWNAKYINGKNHADVIPASEDDAALIQKSSITGSYIRRPVIVTINGTRYAGSMYAVGHGDTSYCSYFKGVMCIHFTGSQTHGSKKVDADHQNAIKEALNYGN